MESEPDLSPTPQGMFRALGGREEWTPHRRVPATRIKWSSRNTNKTVLIKKILKTTMYYNLIKNNYLHKNITDTKIFFLSQKIYLTQIIFV